MTELPQRFKERMRELLGNEYEAFEASYEQEKVQGLRFNSLKTKEGREPDWEEAGVKTLAAETAKLLNMELTPVPWVKEGYYYPLDARPGKHPFHEAGLYYIQEPSAMSVVEFLNPKPGENVLDLCAAPGGKSSHIASRLKGEGFLLSNEIHPGSAPQAGVPMTDGTPAACRQKNAQEFLAGKVPGVMAQYAPGLFSTLQHTHSAHPAPDEDADAVQQLVEWRENAPYG